MVWKITAERSALQVDKAQHLLGNRRHSGGWNTAVVTSKNLGSLRLLHGEIFRWYRACYSDAGSHVLYKSMQQRFSGGMPA